MRVTLTLVLALVILTTAAKLRAPEYDEAYSIFITAGDARPSWPTGVFKPSEVRKFYRGDPSPQQIAEVLRKTDVHPPLYFWALEYWRRIFGPSWLAARMLSVLFSLAALSGIAWLATLAEIPPATAMCFALFSYGFAYTGIVARGFALAEALNILGMALILSATRTRHRRQALAGGLAFGAACFANYLAAFICIATFFWACLQPGRRKYLPPAALGFAVFLPAVLYFYLAQHNSRIGQFQKFSPGHAMQLLAKDFGAALFGGLPVYAGQAESLVTAASVILIAICLACIIKNWQPTLSLFALAVLSVPAGLLALGIVFNNTPIEIRYLAFTLPFVALLLAQTLPPALRHLFLAMQAGGIIGLVIAPSTMQPQAIAMRQAAKLGISSALVLLSFGNDGVGIPGPFIAAAPGDMRIELLKQAEAPVLSHEQYVILPMLRIDDASSKTTSDILAELNADPCWTHRTPSKRITLFVRSCESH